MSSTWSTLRTSRWSRPLAILGLVLGVFASAWGVVSAPVDPLPLAAVIVVLGAALCLRHVQLAAAGLAFVITGHLASVAVNVHGLPSPSDGLAALIVVGILLRRDRLAFLPPPRLLLLFGAYGLVVLGSALWAIEPAVTIETAVRLAKDMVLAGLVAVVVRRTGSLRLILWAILAAACMLAAVTAVQGLTDTFDQSYLGLGGGLIANIVTDSDSWRAAGPFGDPNFYAQTLVVAVAIALNRVLFERAAWLRVLAIAAAGLLTYAIVLTYSRGGAAALVLVIVALLVLHRPRPAVLAAVLLVLVALTVSLPAEFRERLVAATDVADPAGPGDPAVRGRLSEVLAGGQMFLSDPLLGVGSGNYPSVYQEYAREFELETRREPRAPHSLYVEIAAETGALGLAVFLTLIGVGIRSLAVAARYDRGRPVDAARGLHEGLGLAAVAFLSSSIVLHAAHARIFWLLAALVLALPRDGAPDAAVDPRADDVIEVEPPRRLAPPAPTG